MPDQAVTLDQLITELQVLRIQYGGQAVVTIAQGYPVTTFHPPTVKDDMLSPFTPSIVLKPKEPQK